MYRRAIEKASNLVVYYPKIIEDVGRQQLSKILSSSYGETLILTVNSAIDLMDKTVDSYLPPSSDEEKKENDETESKDQQEPQPVSGIAGKVGVLSNKMYRRAIEKASNLVVYYPKIIEDVGRQQLSKVLSSPYGETLILTVNSAIDLVDKTVDAYLPPSSDEEKKENDETESKDSQEPQSVLGIAGKVGVLSNKMYRRAVEKASNLVVYYPKIIEDVGRQQLSKILSSSYGETLILTINSAIDLVDKTVDTYLPPSNDEEKKENDETESKDQQEPQSVLGIAGKVGVLSNKMRKRLIVKASNLI